MALHDRIRKLTYDDYVRIPDDGQRHEIIDGEHYVSPAPLTRHQRLVVKLTVALGSFVTEQRLGEILVAPHDVLLSRVDIVQPDVMFVSNQRAQIVTEKNTQGAPDLIVEILSKSTRGLDEKVKLDLYDRFDVSEYWIIDPDRQTVRIYRRTAESLDLDADLSAAAGDVLTSPFLPGFSLPLAKIFES